MALMPVGDHSRVLHAVVFYLEWLRETTGHRNWRRRSIVFALSVSTEGGLKERNARQYQP
jgi:hypothetical protein